MKKIIWILYIFIAVSLVTASAVKAENFDGSKPLLISIIRAIECTPEGSCREVKPETIQLPQFLKIDFKQNIILPAAVGDETPATRIERQEFIDGKLILQGAEDGYEKMRDGLGWTMAISEETGQVVLTASGEQVAFVVFGAALAL